ncbi:MAG: zinc ribbon domain-containing protein [Chloroflexi bacterium]|nr:zinc ribbon domain-containing protein [Chloroflexota bacterium]
MPLYEYRCQSCHRKVTLLVRSQSQTAASCTFCGSTQLSRLISSFAVLRSEESHMEDLADPSRLGDVDENDPRSIARWARRMGRELGEELGPDFDEMVDKMEAGEMPDDGGDEGAAMPGEI